MTARSRSALTAQFDVIRNETVAGANTRARIADAYQDALDSVVSVATVPEIRAFGAKGADTYLVLLNGSYVPFAWDAASTATDDGQTCIQVTGVATGRYRARVTRALPPYCYGDPIVAREIVNPSSPLLLIRIGDSRMYNISSAVLQGYCPTFQWAGQAIGFSIYPQSFYTGTVYNQDISAPVSTPFGSLSTLTPRDLNVYVHNGGTPGVNDQLSQYFFNTWAPGTHALHQVKGRTIRYTMLLLEGPHGVTNADLQLVIDYVGSTYRGSYFSTYAPTVGVKVVTLDVPSTHNWDSYGTLYAKLVHRYSTATVNGEQVVVLGGCYMPVDAGLSEINCAVGGRRTEHFVDDGIFSSSLWASYFAKISSKAALWIDLGTNGSGVASDAVDKITIARRFRSVFPNAPVLFSTAFPGGSGGVSGELPGCDRGWRRGAIEAAEAIGHSYVIDTYNAMPTAAQAIALGYYAGGDYVHYSAAGNQALAGVISELMRKSAALF